MKTIYLLRHAHAEQNPNKEDLKRNLSDQGKNEARLIAELMLKLQMRPDHILSSHSNRTYQTAEILAETLAFPLKNVQLEEKIYSGDEDIIIELISEQNDMHNSLMLIGHNPVISYLANKLGNYPGSLDTAGLAIFSCMANNWASFYDEEIKLERIITPLENEDVPNSIH